MDPMEAPIDLKPKTEIVLRWVRLGVGRLSMPNHLMFTFERRQ